MRQQVRDAEQRHLQEVTTLEERIRAMEAMMMQTPASRTPAATPFSLPSGLALAAAGPAGPLAAPGLAAPGLAQPGPGGAFAPSPVAATPRRRGGRRQPLSRLDCRSCRQPHRHRHGGRRAVRQQLGCRSGRRARHRRRRCHSSRRKLSSRRGHREDRAERPRPRSNRRLRRARQRASKVCYRRWCRRCSRCLLEAAPRYKRGHCRGNRP